MTQQETNLRKTIESLGLAKATLVYAIQEAHKNNDLRQHAVLSAFADTLTEMIEDLKEEFLSLEGK